MNQFLTKTKVLLMAAALLVASAAAAQKGDTNTRTVRGQVVSANGDGLEKAVVHLKNLKTLQERTYIADEGGVFHFQGLSSNVDYELYAEHEGATSVKRTVSSFDSRRELYINLKVEKK